MIPVFTTAQSKALDAACVAGGIPAEFLMETAASNAIAACDVFAVGRSVLVVCGNGNNGGDGYAMARMLKPSHSVLIAANPQPENMSHETLQNYRRAVDLGIPIVSPDTIGSVHANIIIDALIGVGGSAELRGSVGEYTERINLHPATVVSVDVPTGLDATSGEADPHAVCADHTVTMVGYKMGMLGANGRRLCGRVHVASIGEPTGLAGKMAKGWVLDNSDIRRLLPRRKPDSYKHAMGHVLAIAGSTGMSGAAALAAEAALRAGAGLVTVATDSVHPLLPREVMTVGLHELDAQLSSGLSGIAVVLGGPGFGQILNRLEILTKVVNAVPQKPVVLDADGLRIVPHLTRPLQNVVLTPHPGEFARLQQQLGFSQILPATAEAAEEVSDRIGCVIHLKSIPPTTTDGRQTFYCTRGNPGLATAGTGDVLAGIIAGCIAQGVPPLNAAALGAFIHGSAADLATASVAEESLIAGDLFETIGRALAN